MASTSFRVNVNTHVDEAHNTHFDRQNSPYHTGPHPVTANYSFKYFSVSHWPKSQRYFRNSKTKGTLRDNCSEKG